MTSNLRTHGGVALFGLMLGFSVSMIGFGDFAQLNAMFTFQDLRMFLAFAGAVALAAVGYAIFVPGRPARRPIHRGVVPGAVLFGTGWALSGGCPAIPLVQLGTGYLPAAVTLSGMALGMVLFRSANARWFQLDRGSCGL
ncbi:MAG: YeeE/YedE family protein [Acidimicrobiia bacterium]|nr:YeeE/YedE family protein [Acidimicrobiia bacterium]